MRIFIYMTCTLLLIACGGGGGGEATVASSNNAQPTVKLELSASKSYTGESITINWSSSNAQQCTASNGWSGKRANFGSESITFKSDGVYTFDISCTGNNSTVKATKSLSVFNYSRIISFESDASGILWSGDVTGTSIAGDILGGVYPPNGLSYDELNFNSTEFSSSYEDNLTLEVFQERAGVFDVSLDGMLVQGRIFNNIYFSMNEKANITQDIDYIKSESSSILPLVHISQYFTNAIFETLKIDSYYGDTDTSPEYVDASITELSFEGNGTSNDDYRLIVSSYGDKTKIEDMPSSGVKNFNFSSTGYLFNSIATHEGSRTWGFNNTYARVGEWHDVLVAFGDGNITFDFSNKKIITNPASNFTYSIFQHLPTLRDSSSAYDGDLYYVRDNAASIQDITFTLEDGLIMGETFAASIKRNSPTGSTHVGKIFGSFYGPDASEIGFNIYFDDINEYDDYTILTGFGVGKH